MPRGAGYAGAGDAGGVAAAADGDAPAVAVADVGVGDFGAGGPLSRAGYDDAGVPDGGHEAVVYLGLRAIEDHYAAAAGTQDRALCERYLGVSQLDGGVVIEAVLVAAGAAQDFDAGDGHGARAAYEDGGATVLVAKLGDQLLALLPRGGATEETIEAGAGVGRLVDGELTNRRGRPIGALEREGLGDGNALVIDAGGDADDRAGGGVIYEGLQGAAGSGRVEGEGRQRTGGALRRAGCPEPVWRFAGRPPARRW